MAELAIEPKETKSTVRAEQAALVKVIGQRFKEARELNNLTLSKAAKLLGYRNPSKLSKIENASDTDSVPFFVIYRAAHVYGVSSDFLLNLSSDWEKDPVVSQERQISTALLSHWEKARAAELNAIRILNNKLFTLTKAVSHSLRWSREFQSTVDRMQEINPGFDDKVRLGSKLLRIAAEFTEEAAGISAELKRYRAYVDVADKSANVSLKNSDIFEIEGE
jgi:transcriptional regulator with XRE-family HTH domain